ncbi:DNA gyrase inhibitor YacG [Bacterioplanes sanyensis]|uniref:DNA gyrase inhibitor YacG n=1 Tax=Bacterioplanes sanyensis TaxID=1249553 RepID=A0A222FIS7_9GAMM|nr:DNA gyrase inhibitor YacG [Bacterioplanes sanyensis]ASP38947.1 DNA gyrase inhibitor YacG [Bacterioplanes sanyensis]
MKVNCPTCQKTVQWSSSSRYRPFCSERCKLIDLGEWASEGHAIPGRSVEEELMSEQVNQELKPH